MEKISEEIKSILGEDISTSLDFAKDAYGTVSGAYAYFEAGKKVLTALGILDKPDDPFDKLHEQIKIVQQKLDNILNTLEQARLEQAESTSHITRTYIINEESNVRSAAYNAFWYLKNPDSDDLKRQFLETRDEAQVSINHFRDNSYYWRRVHLDAVDYTDEWSGSLTPPTEGGGLWVFDYLITLPAYLSALANWIIVILASDEGFIKAHLSEGTEITEHIDILQDKLVKILKSFQPIKPPDKSRMKYLVFAADDDRFFCYKTPLGVDTYSDSGPYDTTKYHPWMGGRYEKIPCGQQLMNEQLKYLPGGSWPRSGDPYGVVEKYSGISCIEAYPSTEIKQGASWLTLLSDYLIWDANIHFNLAPTIGISHPAEYQKFYDRFVLRHTLRTWKQARELSVMLRLHKVRDCINQLCAMRKILRPELPTEWNRYVLISLREVCSIVPDSLKNLSESGEIYSLRGLAEAIDIQGPITLRKIIFLDEM